MEQKIKEFLSTAPDSPQSTSIETGIIPFSTKAIDEFKALYLRKYGVQLSDEEARSKGSNLISFLLRIGYPCKKL